MKHLHKNKYLDLIKTEEIDSPQKENCNSISNPANNLFDSNNLAGNPFDQYNPNDANYNFYSNDERLSNLNNFDFKNADITYRNSEYDNEKNGSY